MRALWCVSQCHALVFRTVFCVFNTLCGNLNMFKELNGSNACHNLDSNLLSYNVSVNSVRTVKYNNSGRPRVLKMSYFLDFEFLRP